MPAASRCGPGSSPLERPAPGCPTLPAPGVRCGRPGGESGGSSPPSTGGATRPLPRHDGRHVVGGGPVHNIGQARGHALHPLRVPRLLKGGEVRGHPGRQFVLHGVARQPALPSMALLGQRDRRVKRPQAALPHLTGGSRGRPLNQRPRPRKSRLPHCREALPARHRRGGLLLHGIVGGRAQGDFLVPYWRHNGDTIQHSVARESRRQAQCVADGSTTGALQRLIRIRPCQFLA